MAKSPDEIRNDRERSELQDIINRGLETSSKITRNISKELQSQISSNEQINKFIKDRAAIIDRMVKNEKDESSLAEKIKNTQGDLSKATLAIAKTKKKNGELDKRFSKTTIENLNRNKLALEYEFKKLNATHKGRDAAEEQTKAVMRGLQSAVDSINRLPGGKLLTKKLGFTQENIELMGKNMTKMFSGELPKKASSLFKGIEGASSKTALRLGAAAAAIGIALVLFKTFKSILVSFSNQIDKIGESFGVMGTQDLAKVFTDARPGALALGLDIGDLISITSVLSSEFGIAVDEAQKMSLEIANSSVGMGLAVSEGAKLFGIFMALGGMSLEQAENLAEGTYQLARANKVNPATVMKDIANSSEVFAKFAMEGGLNIKMAAIQATKLGVSLNDVAGIAESLLDFQSSLNKEITAQVMLGRDINLQRARELAMANDLPGMMKEVLKQLGGEAEWNDLLFLQRKSLAELLNMDVTTMNKLVKGQGDLAVQSQAFVDILGPEAMSNLTAILNKFKEMGAEIVKRVGPTLDKIADKFQVWLEGGGFEKIMKVITSISDMLIWIADHPKTIMALLGALTGFALGGAPGAITGAIAGGLAIPFFGMAKGGSFVTSGPTPIMVGEAGKELVQVTPMSSQGPLNSFDVANMRETHQGALTAEVNIKPVADEVSKLQEEMARLRKEMASYFGIGGSAVKGIGTRVGDTIMANR